MATKHVDWYVDDKPVDLFTGDAIQITNSYQQIGEVGTVKMASSIYLWVEITAGTSEDITIRPLVGPTSDNINYQMPIESSSADYTKILPLTYRVPDVGGKYVFEISLGAGIPYIQFYIKDSNGGNGELTKAFVTFEKFGSNMYA